MTSWTEEFLKRRLDHVTEELQARQTAALLYAATADGGNGLRIATWTARAAIEILAIAMDAAVALGYWRPATTTAPSKLSLVYGGIIKMDDLDSRMPPEGSKDAAPIVQKTCTELVDVELAAHGQRAVKVLSRLYWESSEELSQPWLNVQRSLAKPFGQKVLVPHFRTTIGELVLDATKAVEAIHLPGVNPRPDG